MSYNEVLTLQFGNYSNFVGTHYWNFQQKRLNSSIHDGKVAITDHSKLFRESVTNKRQNYIPRTICFDVKGSLNTLKEDGSFNIESGDQIDNDGAVVYAQDAIEKNEFLTEMLSNKQADERRTKKIDLDDKVKSWSDYMSYQLDEQSIQLLRSTYDGKDFHYFGVGQQEYNILQDDIEDKIHYWVEECNSIEGFQVNILYH